MVFKRKGRPSLYFQAQTPTGYKQLSTDTRTKTLANKIVAMWDALADAREWDILNRVLAGELAIGALYDRWAESKQDTGALRRHIEDVEVTSLVPEFLAVYRRGVREDTAQHVRAHLGALLPATLYRSAATPALLTDRLYSYPGRRNTLRKVHSSLSVFFAYLTDVKGLFERNPMEKVERPDVEHTPIRYYELADVIRIVEAQPTEERRALFALLYGSAMEISAALRVGARDIRMETLEIHAAGSKSQFRDRWVRVADWAWPYIEPLARRTIHAPLFPPMWNRWSTSDWHRQTVKALGLPPYPMHNARDHWSVRQLRAGAPVAMVQAQLGHGSPFLTLTKYGRFIPTSDDRARWEKKASEMDRRSAIGGAKKRRIGGKSS